jgi:hypothetical protein
MTPFLEQVASLLYQRHGTAISQMAFVFPNRRSGLFFRKYLSQIAGKPIFAPAILTINELFVQLSNKQSADRIQMLFMLYRIYIRHSNSDETFDDFVFWGEMLLNDFDDVDKYLVDAQRLFSNISDLRIIEKDFSYLQPEQIEAIRMFWSSFQPKGEGENQQSFLEIWKLLYPVYREFRNALAEEGKGYEGMIAREVVEQIKQGKDFELPYKQIVFIGLNAISVVEKELLIELQKQGIADFYWDYASDKITDPDNKASFFVKEHAAIFPSVYPLPAEQLTAPDIRLIGIPSRIGQAKHVYELLKEMLNGRPEMEPEEALRTAIVLPDEHLLVPLLNSVPEEIKHINITLGYPLSNTPVAAFMELILALQKNVRMAEGQLVFYYRDVLSVLNHQYILSFCHEDAQVLIKDITDHNKIYVAVPELSRTPLLSLIFSPVNAGNTISDYLITVLQELNKVISTLYGDKDDDEEPVTMDELEQEFIYHYYTTVNRMRDQILEAGIDMSVETYFRLLKRMTDTITIPFQGEPLSGLQIMGVLETRVLDFDRLIILSMNEGIFPVKRVANSFIPYNLRRGFGLPTYEHQDSVWAYHFYRLISRASEVTLLYDTRTDGLQTGEVSRFVHQLKYHYEQPVNEQLIVYDIASGQSPALQIEKDDVVMEKLAAFFAGGSKALSASSINTYLDCPLKFYFSSLEGMREDEEVSENVESSLFGSILHRVLEILYKPYCGVLITADLLKLAAKESTLTKAIQLAFAELFFHTKDVLRPLNGQSYLTGEMIRKYVLKVLERDRKLTPFRYIQSEKKMQHLFQLSNGREVQLKGFIDRLDEVNEIVRVVDYKTGIKKSLEFKSFEGLFDKTDEKRPQAIMQVFMYAWMYRETVSEGMPVQPVIYYMRDLFFDDFDPAIYVGKEKELVNDFAVHHNEFEENLRICLDELFDPAVPFAQTGNIKNCSYCPFNGICGK